MKIRNIISILIITLFASEMSAQIDLGRIAKKAENTVERKIDRNINNGIDDAIDGAEDGIKGKKKKKRGKNSGPEVITEVQVVKEVLPNEFIGSLTINTSNSNQGDNMINVVMDEYRTAVRPLIKKEPHNLMIYDKQEETMISINNKKYKGKAMKEWKLRDQATEDDNQAVTLTKTTEIRDMNGYIARKYILEGSSMNAEIWFTKEIDADFSLIFELLEIDTYNFNSSYGFPMRIDADLSDGSTETITVDGVVEGPDGAAIFDVSAYELIDMTDLAPSK